MRDKTADFKMRQNSRFSKRDKTADFQNGTKQPILKRNKMSAVTAAVTAGGQYAWNLIYLKRFIFVVWLSRFAPFDK